MVLIFNFYHIKAEKSKITQNRLKVKIRNIDLMHILYIYSNMNSKYTKLIF